MKKRQSKQQQSTSSICNAGVRCKIMKSGSLLQRLNACMSQRFVGSKMM
jgi:hypothetical protein